ncbi:MAG: sigma-70 family RNA polymerase sigma factor [Chthoniobacterales bacterium]
MLPLPRVLPNDNRSAPGAGVAGPEAVAHAARGEGDTAVVPPGPAAKLVENFFRHETGRLHGALLRLLGPQNLALAEDVAQEAMLRAFRNWSMGGIPENPSAWIMRVAMNLAKDALRHQRMSATKEPAIIAYLDQTLAASTLGKESEYEIRDDALRLMFVCCQPAIATDAQVVLALKVLCGFNTAEIARAFLSSEAAIEKQLTRTRLRIQEAGIGFDIPEGEDLAPRFDGVLAALYLLFNEGYKASSGDCLLREELCREAIRLASLLVRHPAGDTPRSHALLALMLLSSARFPTRLSAQGNLMRLDDQDRSQWNQSLIDQGLLHLSAASKGDAVSDYHLQAGIAACHCLALTAAATDWARILRHYDQLQARNSSPIVALNRAVAVAHIRGAQSGLDALDEIPQRDLIETHHLFHAVVGELQQQLGQHEAAAKSFRRALQLAEVGPEQHHLMRMLERSAASEL